MAQIAKIKPRQILDSRGSPTIEVDLELNDGSFGRAAVPSGASTGSREALELRDGGDNYLGKSVLKAVENVAEVASKINGEDMAQQTLDQRLIELDGTPTKSQIGANAILAISMAFARAVSVSEKKPLWRYIADISGLDAPKLPTPMFNIMNGGAHAGWTTDIQEYMVIPQGDLPYVEKLRKSVEVFQHLGKLIASKGLSTNVGNEGGYAPALKSNEEAFELILEAISKAGYAAGQGQDFGLALDIAASEFRKGEKYELKRDGRSLSSDEMVEFVVALANKYPLVSIEDPLAEDDWAGWQKLTAQLGSKIQVVGDDLLVTNPQYVERAINEKSCNALLVKLNQIGTLSETLAAMKMSRDAGWKNVPSHRSGETEDVFLAHLAVGTGAGQIKTGAPSRTDRTAKYNELIRIAEELEAA